VATQADRNRARRRVGAGQEIDSCARIRRLEVARDVDHPCQLHTESAEQVAPPTIERSAVLGCGHPAAQVAVRRRGDLGVAHVVLVQRLPESLDHIAQVIADAQQRQPEPELAGEVEGSRGS